MKKNKKSTIKDDFKPVLDNVSSDERSNNDSKIPHIKTVVDETPSKEKRSNFIANKIEKNDHKKIKSIDKSKKKIKKLENKKNKKLKSKSKSDKIILENDDVSMKPTLSDQIDEFDDKNKKNDNKKSLRNEKYRKKTSEKHKKRNLKKNNKSKMKYESNNSDSTNDVIVIDEKINIKNSIIVPNVNEETTNDPRVKDVKEVVFDGDDNHVTEGKVYKDFDMSSQKILDINNIQDGPISENDSLDVKEIDDDSNNQTSLKPAEIIKNETIQVETNTVKVINKELAEDLSKVIKEHNENIDVDKIIKRKVFFEALNIILPSVDNASYFENIRNLYLRVFSGEVVTIFGNSFSGKTELINKIVNFNKMNTSIFKYGNNIFSGNHVTSDVKDFLSRNIMLLDKKSIDSLSGNLHVGHLLKNTIKITGYRKNKFKKIFDNNEYISKKYEHTIRLNSARILTKTNNALLKIFEKIENIDRALEIDTSNSDELSGELFYKNILNSNLQKKNFILKYNNAYREMFHFFEKLIDEDNDSVKNERKEKSIRKIVEGELIDSENINDLYYWLDERNSNFKDFMGINDELRKKTKIKLKSSYVSLKHIAKRTKKEREISSDAILWNVKNSEFVIYREFCNHYKYFLKSLLFLSQTDVFEMDKNIINTINITISQYDYRLRERNAVYDEKHFIERIQNIASKIFLDYVKVSNRNEMSIKSKIASLKVERMNIEKTIEVVTHNSSKKELNHHRKNSNNEDEGSMHSKKEQYDELTKKFMEKNEELEAKIKSFDSLTSSRIKKIRQTIPKINKVIDREVKIYVKISKLIIMYKNKNKNVVVNSFDEILDQKIINIINKYNKDFPHIINKILSQYQYLSNKVIKTSCRTMFNKKSLLTRSMFKHKEILDMYTFDVKIAKKRLIQMSNFIEYGRKIKKSKVKKMIDEIILTSALNKVKLSSGLQNKFVDELSEEQKVRVSIANSIVHKPKMLIIDRVFSYLDYESKDILNELITYLSEDENMSILISTNSFESILKLNTYLILLDDGKIVETGKKLELLSNPIHPLTKWYVKNIDYGANIFDKKGYTKMEYTSTYDYDNKPEYFSVSSSHTVLSTETQLKKWTNNIYSKYDHNVKINYNSLEREIENIGEM